MCSGEDVQYVNSFVENMVGCLGMSVDGGASKM